MTVTLQRSQDREFGVAALARTWNITQPDGPELAERVIQGLQLASGKLFMGRWHTEGEYRNRFVVESPEPHPYRITFNPEVFDLVAAELTTELGIDASLEMESLTADDRFVLEYSWEMLCTEIGPSERELTRFARAQSSIADSSLHIKVPDFTDYSWMNSPELPLKLLRAMFVEIFRALEGTYGFVLPRR